MIAYYILFILALPLIGVAILSLYREFADSFGGVITTIISGSILMGISMLYPFINTSKVFKYQINIGLPLPFALYVDALGYFMAVVIAFIWFMASWYSIEYMKKEHSRGRFHIFSLFSLFGMLGMVITGNLLSFYIFFEIMSILSYFLVIHEETPKALFAGIQYLLMGIIGGLILLGAIIMTYLIVGNLDLSGKGLLQLQRSPYFMWIFGAYIFGFAVKAGMFPVHIWLPNAHPIAPSPASVLLSAVMIKAGAYGIIRTIYAIFGFSFMKDCQINKVLMVLAIFTMLLGSAVALTQTELKRLLAYSSIAQIGYVILGATLLSQEGLIGGILHIANHAMMKGVLFMCAGAIIYKMGLRNIRDLKGISRRMPLTMVAFSIAALSMIGFPPFVGFVSKWFLALGALSSAQGNIIHSGTSLIIIGALIVSSILNAIYYGPIIIKGWFARVDKGERGSLKAMDPSWNMLLPMFILIGGIIFFAIYPEFLLNLARLVATFYIT